MGIKTYVCFVVQVHWLKIKDKVFRLDFKKFAFCLYSVFVHPYGTIAIALDITSEEFATLESMICQGTFRFYTHFLNLRYLILNTQTSYLAKNTNSENFESRYGRSNIFLLSNKS